MVHIMGIDPKQAQIAYLVVKSTTMALEPVFWYGAKFMMELEVRNIAQF
jgi:hypothetical protein